MKEIYNTKNDNQGYYASIDYYFENGDKYATEQILIVASCLPHADDIAEKMGHDKKQFLNKMGIEVDYFQIEIG